MAGIVWLLFLSIVVGATVVAWTAIRAHRSPRRFPPGASSALRSAGTRGLIACGASLAALIGLLAWAAVDTANQPLALALAPLLSVSIGIGCYTLLRPATGTLDEAQPRSASLAQRTWWAQAPRPVMVALVGSWLATIATLVITGLTTTMDEFGNPVFQAESLTYPQLVSTSGPYPGWGYGVPLLAALGLLIAATWLALRRISSTAALPAAEFARADAAWRRGSAEVVVLIALAGAGSTLSGVLAVTGLAVGGAYRGVDSQWAAIGTAVIALAVVCGIGSIISVTTAALRSRELVSIAVGSPEPSPA